MDWLGILMAALPGSTKESLDLLLKELNVVRDASGSIPDERIPEVLDKIAAAAQAAVSPETIAKGVAEFIAVFEGRNWGPPNPGAGAII